MKCGVDSSALAFEWVVSYSKLVELLKMVEFFIISARWDNIICQVGLSFVRAADDLNTLHLLLREANSWPKIANWLLPLNFLLASSIFQ